MAVRQALWAAGLRYRVDYPITTPARMVRPDMVFISARVAVFIDGCFWHACPQHATQPTRNATYWSAKLARNVQRDTAVNLALEQAQWTVLRAWEHESPSSVAERVQAAIVSSQGVSAAIRVDRSIDRTARP